MGRPVERGYYWHDDDVVLVDIGVPTDPLDRTTDEHGNHLQVLCWGEIRAGKVLVRPVVDDGRWGERVERPKDSRTGADRAPDRYMATGRETIDRMRDLAHALFGEPGLADAAFAFHCLATAMKYADRTGLKGDAEVDRAKADWYRRMVDHVVSGGDDPRSGRPAFEPWRLVESAEVGFEGAMLWGKLGEGGGADGLFVVGRGPEYRAMVWSSLSRRERQQLARVSPGDVVDVLLDDGRIVRTTAQSALIDQGARRLRQRTFHLTGIRGRYAAERVRVPGGWARKKGFTHHDHVGVPGQRVPYTCPAMREILGLLAGAGLDAGVMQRIVGRLELIRAYNAQLRRNQGRR